jgi:hypothetical protein
MAQRHCLTDDQWELIADLGEAEPKATGRPLKDRRALSMAFPGFSVQGPHGETFSSDLASG